MPVVAIVGAIAAIGIAAETGFAVFATIAAVGATIGAVGAVTNNKALMIAGGVIGAVGGIGALAQSAGIIGGDVGLFGGSFGDGFGSGGSVFGGESFGPPANLSPQASIDTWSGVGPEPFGPPNPNFAGTPALSGAPTAGGASVDATSGAFQSVDVNPTLTAASSPDVTPTGVINPPQGTTENLTLGGQNNPAANTGGGIVNTPSSPGVTAPASSNGVPAGFDVQGNPLATATGGTGVTPESVGAVTGTVNPNATYNTGITLTRGPSTNPDSSVWSSIGDILDKKGASTVLSGVLQAGASFISGATNGLTPAQIAALNAQAEANQAATNLSRIQQSNIQQPLPAAWRTPPVTGAPAGMINTPPKINVTGAA